MGTIGGTIEVAETVRLWAGELPHTIRLIPPKDSVDAVTGARRIIALDCAGRLSLSPTSRRLWREQIFRSTQ